MIFYLLGAIFGILIFSWLILKGLSGLWWCVLNLQWVALFLSIMVNIIVFWDGYETVYKILSLSLTVLIIYFNVAFTFLKKKREEDEQPR